MFPPNCWITDADAEVAKTKPGQICAEPKTELGLHSMLVEKLHDSLIFISFNTLGFKRDSNSLQEEALRSSTQ